MTQIVRKLSILIVDDQPKVLRFIGVYLKLQGFEVATAASGEQALEMVKSAEPDAMLLDVVMPDMDGFEVLRRLRQFSQLPVIAFSASHGNHDEALKCGADDFVSKPFRPDELAKRIEALVRR